MAISEIPSLHLKPVAYKTNKLYLKLPEGSIGNMTFARTSIATRVNKEGLIEEVATGIPRLDYTLINGVVQSCPDLLLEPTSTNLLRHSEEFITNWFKGSNTTRTSNAGISPDGTENATSFLTTALGNNFIRQTLLTNLVAGTKYNASIWMKSLSGDVALSRLIRLITTTGSDVQSYSNTVTSEWQRFDFTITAQFSVSYYVYFALDTPDDTEILMWGSQFEELPYSTSYIKTEGSSVTRATEECNSAGDSTTFNSVEGVLFLELKSLSESINTERISISNDSTTDRVLVTYLATDGTIEFRTYVSNVNECDININGNIRTDFLKIAFKWKLNDFAVWINGIEVGTDTGAVWNANVLTKLHFDNGAGGGSSAAHGRIKEIKVFKTALTDSELQTLTT